MKNAIKRGLNLLLAFAICLSMSQMVAFADEETVELGVNKALDKSKTATPLDANDESMITLSIPSEGQTLSTDIVFVVDGSDCFMAVKAEFQRLINELKIIQSQSRATIKIGIVAFGWTSKDVLNGLQDLATTDLDSNAILETINGYNFHGTNIDTALVRAKKMLDEDGEVLDSRKYLIMVTDGLTWMWEDDETGDAVTNNNWYVTRSGNTTRPRFNYGTNVFSTGRLGTWDSFGNNIPAHWDSWESYWSQISAWSEADKADSEWSAAHDIHFTEYASNASDAARDQQYAIPYNPEEDVKNGGFGPSHALNMERAIYEAYKTYAQIAEKYNCFTLSTLSPNSKNVFRRFTDMLNGGKQLVFEDIRDDILYAFDTGSKIKDYVGYGDDYDFNFIDDADSLTLKLSDSSYEAVKLESEEGVTSTYGFKSIEGTNQTDGVSYAVVLKYTQGNSKDEEVLNWEFHEGVSNFTSFSLSYKVKLTTKPQGEGEYTVYPNISATLYPKNCKGEDDKPELFDRPELPYREPTNTDENPNTNEDDKPKPSDEPEPSIQPEPPHGEPVNTDENPNTSSSNIVTLLMVAGLSTVVGINAIAIAGKKR